jgi:hypothetical protein
MVRGGRRAKAWGQLLPRCSPSAGSIGEGTAWANSFGFGATCLGAVALRENSHGCPGKILTVVRRGWSCGPIRDPDKIAATPLRRRWPRNTEDQPWTTLTASDVAFDALGKCSRNTEAGVTFIHLCGAGLAANIPAPFVLGFRHLC